MPAANRVARVGEIAINISNLALVTLTLYSTDRVIIVYKRRFSSLTSGWPATSCRAIGSFLRGVGLLKSPLWMSGRAPLRLPILVQAIKAARRSKVRLIRGVFNERLDLSIA